MYILLPILVTLVTLRNPRSSSGFFARAARGVARRTTHHIIARFAVWLGLLIV